MGKVSLFAAPNAVPKLPWAPTEDEVRRHGREEMEQLRQMREIESWLDNSIREKVAVLVSVLGLTELETLCLECGAKELVELTKRPDVCAVLDAYQRGKSAAERRAS